MLGGSEYGNFRRSGRFLWCHKPVRINSVFSLKFDLNHFSFFILGMKAMKMSSLSAQRKCVRLAIRLWKRLKQNTHDLRMADLFIAYKSRRCASIWSILYKNWRTYLNDIWWTVSWKILQYYRFVKWHRILFVYKTSWPVSKKLWNWS